MLQAQPLTKQNFERFGDVIEMDGADHFPINAGAIERFHNLANVDVGREGGRALISIFKCNDASELPFRIEVVERHALGSQAFYPLSNEPMLVVVGPAGDSITPGDLEAFITNGSQGVNYHPGVWHMPLIAGEAGLKFLVVDRGGPGNNCDEVRFDDLEVMLSY